MYKKISSQILMVVCVSFAGSYLSAEALKHQNAATLDRLLLMQPILIHYMETCSKQAIKTDKKINDTTQAETRVLEGDAATDPHATSKEELDIPQEIRKLLGPVKEFMLNIFQYKKLIEPLVQESLERSSSGYAGTIIQKFINSSQDEIIKYKDNICEYFVHHVTTVEELSRFCKEMAQILPDLVDSFPNSRKALLELKKRAQASANR